MNKASQRRSFHCRADLVPSDMGERKKSKHCSSGAEESCPDASQTNLKEWDALYTTQKTQKSKKYHDGIMRLTSCASYSNQVILLNEDGAVLSSKYLTSVECIRTGHNFEFSNYLVEIGEPRTIPEDDICKGVSERVAGSKFARIGEFMGKQRDCSKNSVPCESKKEHSEQVADCSSSEDARFTDLNNKQICNVRKKSEHCISGAQPSRLDASQTILKEWDALYTTQLTQKSKKYHDGIMRLAGSGSYMNQVILLNEDGAVLSSKYLTSVEGVRTGHNFEFSNYLVEIGEARTIPEDDICKGVSEWVAGAKSARIGEFMGKQRDCSKNSVPCDSKKEHSEQVADCSSSDDARFTDLNNKQICDVRKKSEHCISGAQPSRLDASQTILKEWDALYTTQLTQKSKKYHDGIMRLASSGSYMNQVFLLNEDGAVLSSKYLKSVECVKTGHNYEFSNYLVEIGEPRTLPGDIKKEHSEQVAECSRSDDARSRDLNDKQIHDEWSALYTTQISQKVKKYHDGILRLANCGLHTNQVTLLNEDGIVLSSKYLKLVECVDSGRTCEFPNYLVQICEKRNPTRDDTTKPLLEQVAGSRSISSGKLTSRRKNCVDKTLPKDIHVSYSEQVGSRSISDGQFTTLKGPIRDASQILSTLRRPSYQGLACDRPSRDALISNTSDLIPLNVENNSNVAELNVPVTTNSGQIMDDNTKGDSPVTTNSGQVMDDNPKGDSPGFDLGGAYQITTSKASCLKSKDACETSTCDNAIVAGNGHQCTSPSSKHSIWSTQLPWGPHDKMIEITTEGKSFHYSSDEEQHHADSSSPMKGNISPDENQSLSDQIKTLQEEWTTLAHRVSTIGNSRSSIRFPQDNTQADEILLSATPPCPLTATPPCLATESKSGYNHSELVLSKDSLNVDNFPTFDLGFE